MNTSADMGLALARTFGMLVVVIGILVLLLYVVRRIASSRGGKDRLAMIKVLATHHFSPREKVALIEVLDRKVLVGITQQSISPLLVFGPGSNGDETVESEPQGFDTMLKDSLDRKSRNRDRNDASEEGGEDDR